VSQLNSPIYSFNNSLFGFRIPLFFLHFLRLGRLFDLILILGADAPLHGAAKQSDDFSVSLVE